jgi:glycerol-3-phosphate acyltransferase PlsY
VATGFGAFLVVAPLAAAVGLAVWIVILAIWRMVSLASMLATVVFPVVLGMLVRPPMPVLVATSLVAVIVVLRHAQNLRHILDGTERRIGDDGGEP